MRAISSAGRRDAPTPMRSAPRALQVFLLIAAGLVIAALLALGPLRRIGPERLARAWSRWLLAVLDLRVVMRGRPATGARLTVANHVSWLDIPVIASLEATRFVSKSEVRRWPVAGTLARAAGTFFLRRGKGGAAPVLQEITPHLAAGGSVVVFPEGTTTDGSGIRPFHPRLFEAAIRAGCPVQPLALRYEACSNGNAVAPFIEDMDLVSHVCRVLKEPRLIVHVTYFAPIPVEGCTRDALAEGARGLIVTALPCAARERGPAPPVAAGELQTSSTNG